MARSPDDRMSRPELADDLPNLSEARNSSVAAPNPGLGKEAEQGLPVGAGENFRSRMRDARPDLQVFRDRPAWQQAVIRTIWRTQALFGLEEWVPRRERAAAESLQHHAAWDRSSQEDLRRFLHELSVVSARHRFWIKNAPRGAQLVAKGEGMLGYYAIPRPGNEGRFEFGSYRLGSPTKGSDLVVGFAQTLDAQGEGSESAAPSVAQSIFAPGVEQPVGFIKRVGDRVELTLFGEREAGFLDYVAANGDEVVNQLMRSFGREHDVQKMNEGYENDDRMR